MAYFISKWTDHGNEVIALVHRDTIEKLNKAADMVRDKMKVECPVGATGNLKKSIRIQRFPEKLLMKIIAGSKKAWYPHLVIFGSPIAGIRFTKGRGPKRFKRYSTGFMQPNNFMLRALNEKKTELVQMFGKPITVVEK